MLLVISDKVLDESLIRLRIVQENCLQSHDKVSASLVERVINDLNQNSVSLTQSIARGAESIKLDLM